MDKVTATDFSRNLSDFLNRVRYRDESFVIERNKEAVALVTPPGSPPAPPSGGDGGGQPIATLSEIAQRLAGVAWPGEGFAEDLLWARDRRSRA